MRERPEDIRRYCPICNREGVLFRAKRNNLGKWYYPGKCYECEKEYQKLWRTGDSDLYNLRLNKCPADTMIERAPKTSPCTDCPLLDRCRKMVMGEYRDPVCWVSSEVYADYVVYAGTTTETRKWKNGKEWVLNEIY